MIRIKVSRSAQADMNDFDIDPPEQRRQPSQDRGRKRVETILTAASGVFADRGYAGATMTEISVRAETHIGSLYRFFPTKRAIADALMERYRAMAESAGSRLIEQAATLSVPAFADALIEMMLHLRGDRGVAMELSSEAGQSGSERRDAVREMMLQICERAVVALRPDIDRGRAAPIAQTLVYMIKVVILAADDADREDRGQVGEIRRLMLAYLEQSLG